ncbi:MAG: hypothetical protein HRU19_15450 [Pseudobacteriovorax sp.]|nr:hypothetical protein [Pseudobacteriovorax sp.]
MKLVALAFASLTLATAALSDTNDKQNRVEELKATIIEIAGDATRNDAPALLTRNSLDPLVNELLELSPTATEPERAALVAGGWRNVWTDNGFGPGTDPFSVYQVVSKDGFYYNISSVTTAAGTFTSFLRGAYETKASYLAIEFTSNGINNTVYHPGTNLIDLAQRVEAGQVATTPVPGPIGVTGVLMNIFVDDELRIVYGNSSFNSRPRLFILTRSDVIAH